MLTLWYIILGWKEYNKSFKKAEEPPKPVDSAKKPDLIPQKKDVVPTPSQIINKSEPSKSIPIDPKSPVLQPEPSFYRNKVPEVPEISERKLISPSPKVPEIPKPPEIPKMPEQPKQTPLTPETPKTPEVPRIPPRTPDTPKTSDFKLAPEVPKKADIFKTPDPATFVPRTPQPEAQKVTEGPPNALPSRRPESVMPAFPPSNVDLPPGRSEFPIPPYLPGAPQNKPPSKDDELFALSNTFSSPSPNRPAGNLRDLSYAKGEFPGEVAEKVQGGLSKIPKYMEQSVISNPDSLESEEEDEPF